MDEKTVTLNSNKVLTKKFIPNGKGYDPDEVDNFLDFVVKDYVIFEDYVKESRDYIVNLETQLKNEKEKVNILTLENARLKSRLDGIKENDQVNLSNIEYIKKIDKYEKALYAVGIDPNKIK